MNNRVTPEKITELKPGECFVYGSNLSGRHGKGAAKTATKWGAEYGVGRGPSGQTYAIPTKDYAIRTLSLEHINLYVEIFAAWAAGHPNQTFLVTPIGTGLAGYKPEDIAPMFKDCVDLPNVHLPQSFWDVLTIEPPSAAAMPGA